MVHKYTLDVPFHPFSTEPDCNDLPLENILRLVEKIKPAWNLFGASDGFCANDGFTIYLCDLKIPYLSDPLCLAIGQESKGSKMSSKINALVEGQKPVDLPFTIESSTPFRWKLMVSEDGSVRGCYTASLLDQTRCEGLVLSPLRKLFTQAEQDYCFQKLVQSEPSLKRTAAIIDCYLKE